MIGNETDEIIEELFNSLLQRYQGGLEEKMRGSDFLCSCWSVVFQISYNKSKSR